MCSCPGFPPEVGAFECARDRTENGLRVKDGRLTKDGSGRLIFALLHKGRYLTEKDLHSTPNYSRPAMSAFMPSPMT